MIGLLLWLFLLLPLLLGSSSCCHALNVVLAGGTGPVGRALAPRLDEHDVTVLARNAFLASAPARVTEQFGYFGAHLLRRNPHVRLRDWDAGNLLDVVGQDWMGWQEDCLKDVDVIVHLTGGFTEQRVMACEQLIREAHRFNGMRALHMMVNPTDEDMTNLAPSVNPSIKKKRIEQCEAMVKENCPNHKCLRVETNRLKELCDTVKQIIEEWAREKTAPA